MNFKYEFVCQGQITQNQGKLEAIWYKQIKNPLNPSFPTQKKLATLDKKSQKTTKLGYLSLQLK